LRHSNFTQAQVDDAMERYKADYTGPPDMTDGEATAAAAATTVAAAAATTTTTTADGSPTDTAAAPAFPVAATQEASVGAAEDSSSNTFSITGSVYAPLYLSNNTEPINGIEVCAYDHLVSTRSVLTVLLTTEGEDACTFTSNRGEYRIDSIQNDDPDDASNVDLVIRVSSRGSNDLVVHGISGVYTESSTRVLNFSEDTRMFDFVLDGRDARASGIINAISDGRDFFSHHGIHPE